MCRHTEFKHKLSNTEKKKKSLKTVETRWVCSKVSDSKESACNAGDLGSIHGSGRYPGEGNGNPPQYSCLVHSMDRGTWWATLHGIAKNQKWLSDFLFHCLSIGQLPQDLSKKLMISKELDSFNQRGSSSWTLFLFEEVQWISLYISFLLNHTCKTH